MATLQSTTYDLLVTNLLTDGIQAQGSDLGGKLRVAWFTHLAAAESTSDVIQLTIVPDGARILGVMLHGLDNGVGTTLDIGDADDVDRLVDGYVVGTGTFGPEWVTMALPDAETPTKGWGYKYTARTVITATVLTAALGTAIIYGAIVYAQE